MAKYCIRISEHDVWGNEEDGYYVNDTYPHGKAYEVSDLEQETILELLKSTSVLGPDATLQNVVIDMDYAVIFVDSATGIPIATLYIDEEGKHADAPV